MSRNRTPRYPSSSFGPQMHDILRAGASEKARYEFDTPARATTFMHRLHSLRKALKEENHPDWLEYYRCGVHRDPSDRKVVIIQPRDSEFEAFIKIAPSPLPKAETPKIPDPVGPQDPTDEFLKSLRDLEKKD